MNVYENTIQNYGLCKEGYSLKALIFDGVCLGKKRIVNTTGQWDGSIPRYEAQASEDGWDTDGCTVWGTQNCIETLEKHRFGVEKNYSERYTYNGAKIQRPGSTPDFVGAVIDELGLLEEHEMPFTKTYEEFITPRPLDDASIKKGKEWLKKYSFSYDFVFPYKNKMKNGEKKIELMKEHLKYSPLGVSVSAWYLDGVSDTYIDAGYENNHWCECYGWNEKGWKIFDSYDNSKKILSFDHNISTCMWYSLNHRMTFRNIFNLLIHANK